MVFARADFVNVHCDRKRFVVRADEKLTAFVELEAAIAVSPNREGRREISGLYGVWYGNDVFT
jgi:hypothetical protein